MLPNLRTVISTTSNMDSPSYKTHERIWCGHHALCALLPMQSSTRDSCIAVLTSCRCSAERIAHYAILEPSGLSAGLLKKSWPVTSCVTAPLAKSAAAAAAAGAHQMQVQGRGRGT
jgi:hypothetical protein